MLTLCSCNYKPVLYPRKSFWILTGAIFHPNLSQSLPIHHPTFIIICQLSHTANTFWEGHGETCLYFGLVSGYKIHPRFNLNFLAIQFVWNSQNFLFSFRNHFGHGIGVVGWGFAQIFALNCIYVTFLRIYMCRYISVHDCHCYIWHISRSSHSASVLLWVLHRPLDQTRNDNELHLRSAPSGWWEIWHPGACELYTPALYWFPSSPNFPFVF